MVDKPKDTKIRKSTEMTQFCLVVTENKTNSGSQYAARKYKQILQEMRRCLLKRDSMDYSIVVPYS